MAIYINNDIDKKIWDELTIASAYHNWQWNELIKNSYHLEYLKILAISTDGFALISLQKVGKKYISLPFLSYSGFLFSCEQAKKEIELYLTQKNISIDDRSILSNTLNCHYVGSVADISEIESYWLSLASKMRNQIRKSQANEFEVKIAKDVSIFYEIYSLGMKNLGTPVHSKRFFENILSQIEGSGTLSIYYKEKPVASMLFINDKFTFYDMFAYCKPEYNSLYANYFLYWSSIIYANKIGKTKFDFGRSTQGSGVFLFKQKFNVTNYGIKSQIDYGKSKLQIFTKLWMKLPYKTTLILGPLVRKYLP